MKCNVVHKFPLFRFEKMTSRVKILRALNMKPPHKRLWQTCFTFCHVTIVSATFKEHHSIHSPVQPKSFRHRFSIAFTFYPKVVITQLCAWGETLKCGSEQLASLFLSYHSKHKKTCCMSAESEENLCVCTCYIFRNYLFVLLYLLCQNRIKLCLLMPVR